MNQFKIEHKIEYEGAVRFALLYQDKKELIAVSHEYDRIIDFHNATDFVNSHKVGNVSTPLYSYKNWKKVTLLLDVDFTHSNTDINGLLFADKTGEIKFLNTNNLSKLSKIEEVPGRNEVKAGEFDFVSKLVYGH